MQVLNHFERQQQNGRTHANTPGNGNHPIERNWLSDWQTLYKGSEKNLPGRETISGMKPYVL